MNKAELVEQIVADAGITRVQASAVVESFTENVMDTLKKGDRVTLIGFGTFLVVDRAARTARNPQTGALIKIKATKAPRFKAGSAFAERIASNKK